MPKKHAVFMCSCVCYELNKLFFLRIIKTQGINFKKANVNGKLELSNLKN